MLFETKYELQQVVYLKTDIEQRKRMVININILPSGLQYLLSFGAHATWHYEMEITDEVDTLIKV